MPSLGRAEPFQRRHGICGLAENAQDGNKIIGNERKEKRMNEVVLKLTKEELDVIWLCMCHDIRRKVSEGFGKNSSIYDAMLTFHVYNKIENARAGVLKNEDRNGV